MAKATVSSRDITVTLELTQDEALYAQAALANAEPAEGLFDGSDPVFEALYQALEDAGIDHYDYEEYLA